MVPLDDEGIPHARSWLPAPKAGLLALHHALESRRPGLWGDDRKSPRSLVFIREGDGVLEAFGAGAAEPAAAWLVGLGRAVTLLAPSVGWWESILGRVDAASRREVETWGVVPGDHRLAEASLVGRVLVRALGPDDERAFLDSAPPWALRGWGSYAELVAHGAAFGVPHEAGFAALAWVFDRTEAPPLAGVGVFTAPRFRRLGLGRASASRLVGVLESRRQTALWSLAAENAASRELARSLGLGLLATEPLLRWPAAVEDRGNLGNLKNLRPTGGGAEQ